MSCAAMSRPPPQHKHTQVRLLAAAVLAALLEGLTARALLAVAEAKSAHPPTRCVSRCVLLRPACAACERVVLAYTCVCFAVLCVRVRGRRPH